MSSGFGFWEVLSVMGAVQGFLLGVALWAQSRGRPVANRLLALLVFLFSLHLLHIVLYWTQALRLVPHIWGVVWFFPYLYGPITFFYARSLLDADYRLAPRHLVHLAPFILCHLFFLRFYLSSAESKARMLEQTYVQTVASLDYVALAFWMLQFLHFLAYVVAGRRLLARRADRAWLVRVMTFFAAAFSCWFLHGIAVLAGLAYSKGIDYGATLAMTGSIYVVGYAALRKPELFAGKLRGSYQRSALTPAEVEECEGRLLELMHREAPYRDQELRIDDLATRLGVPSYELSQVINQKLGQHFNDFLNRYRVEDVKRLLSDPGRSGDSVLSLAFEAGFNNKTTFNQAFKKYTRTTPSRFRASVHRQLS